MFLQTQQAHLQVLEAPELPKGAWETTEPKRTQQYSNTLYLFFIETFKCESNSIIL